jgi:hypothetical protein
VFKPILGFPTTQKTRRRLRLKDRRIPTGSFVRPSGGAKSVRLKLQGEWEKSYSDEMLLNEIQAQQGV